MAAALSLQDSVTATFVAAAIGFLVGRTREVPEESGKPGIRDFVIISMLGAIAGMIGVPSITCMTGGMITAILIVLRVQHPTRTGITSEFSAVLTFFLGYLCLSGNLQIAAAIGILLTLVLTAKIELHSFALRTITQREFADTVKFLALIFLILPLLPPGKFGPFGFFEPRKIWYFVILVSGVSFTGYFLTRFLDRRSGIVLTAIVGGLASTTAYTAGAAKAVRERPESGATMSGPTILANSIMFPRIYILLLAISPPLAQAAFPVLAIMLAAGILLALPNGLKSSEPGESNGFENPFSLLPALRFGLIFTAVLFVSAFAVNTFGAHGQLAAAGLGGLADVDAVVLTTASGLKSDAFGLNTAVLTILIGVTANTLFKAVLAAGSGVPAFYLRVVISFALILGVGAVAFVFLPLL